jgi:hypothetical protein
MTIEIHGMAHVILTMRRLSIGLHAGRPMLVVGSGVVPGLLRRGLIIAKFNTVVSCLAIDEALPLKGSPL